jgi:hypothetical protein
MLFSDIPCVSGSFTIAVILVSEAHENYIFQSKKNTNLYAFFSSAYESTLLPLIKAFLLLGITYLVNSAYPNIPFYGHLGGYLISFMLSKSISTYHHNSSKESKFSSRLWLLLSNITLAITIFAFT